MDLKLERVRRGITQRKLANLLQKPIVEISLMEKGKLALPDVSALMEYPIICSDEGYLCSPSKVSELIKKYGFNYLKDYFNVSVDCLKKWEVLGFHYEKQSQYRSRMESLINKNNKTLRQLRLERGLSGSKVAALYGLSLPTYYSLERTNRQDKFNLDLLIQRYPVICNEEGYFKTAKEVRELCEELGRDQVAYHFDATNYTLNQWLEKGIHFTTTTIEKVNKVFKFLHNINREIKPEVKREVKAETILEPQDRYLLLVLFHQVANKNLNPEQAVKAYESRPYIKNTK